ncbi:MAG: tetratricopeptide repeat protein [Nitrospiraceae bacterium]
MKIGQLTPCPLVALWAFVLCLGSISCEARRADKAYLRGDYAKAAKELQWLAEQGDARAQYDLGLLYDTGRGVPQSDEKALRWYQQAAEQGEARAQYNLGLMYANGQGVQQDYAQAYFWSSLSAAQGNGHAMDARDFLYEKMTPEQVVRARQLLLEYEKGRKLDTSCQLCPLLKSKSAR